MSATASQIARNRSKMLRLYRRHFNPALALHFELAGCTLESSARGAVVVDETGAEFLDVGTAHGVFGVGHCEPQIRRAVLDQLRAIASSPPELSSESRNGLESRLAMLLPGSLNRVLFAGSGSEAIEIALRTALLARSGRTRLVAVDRGYHGKTLGALGVMGMEHLRTPFEPLWRNVTRVPYDNLEAMTAAVGDDVAAVFLEPVLGGGTIQVPSSGYLRAVRALCDKHGALLVADEVQTGLGRTGEMFGIDHAGIVPDAIVLSKTLTGGHVPIAVTVVREEIMDGIEDPMRHEQSFGSASAGWPIAAAAADATLDFIVANALPARAKSLGEYLLSCLRNLAESFPGMVLDTPGVGLMAGIRVRNRVIEHALWMQLQRRGVIVGLSLNSGASTPVLRVYPPLTIRREQVDCLVETLHDSLTTLRRKGPRALTSVAAPAAKYQFYLPRRALAAIVNHAASAPELAGGR